VQIHELTNTADLSSTDYVGVDNGTTTRRFDLGALIASIRNRLAGAETEISNLQTSVSDVQGDVADAQSDITGLGTRLDAAESSITSQGTRLSTAESDIDALEGRATTAESNITSLQNNKVDMTTPLLNFDDTATDPLTDDGALANALTALGILSDVIPSGGGSLYLKKALTELAEQITTKHGSITIESGYTGTVHSGTNITKQGDIVNTYIRLQPITIPAGNNQIVATIDQSAFHPKTVVYGVAQLGGTLVPCSINSSGRLILNVSTALTDSFVIVNMSYNVK